ncbi:late competence development ComFB family protein [Paenibacillus filicis]|uniref:Late competence development ComFB family protein n=1 Tax=Paenibacillus gyeongsangnamensis TaxID=3388067 RepID=A0ABT4Q2Z6_9BACL|nr:late competence development ComFB family protein [Paenibacillus filicis]MCZ8511214.1 late competence development ComFB family protein [Paenibacillus filicis]
MNVHNLMEDMVRACLKELMLHQEGLGELSEKEQSDIMAIALNRLPTKYVASAKGEVFAKTQLGMQVETDVYRELTGAVEKVLHSGRKSDL